MDGLQVYQVGGTSESYGCFSQEDPKYQFETNSSDGTSCRFGKAKTTVFERRNKPETNPYTLRTVLPLRRIETCEAQVAQFQNRWYGDHEARMPQTGVTVQAGGVVYNVIMLKAMRSWHTAIFRFVGIESAMKWVEKYDETAWTTDDSIWTEVVADKATLIDFLKQVNVLGDIYDATGFCRETPLERSSMDLDAGASTFDDTESPKRFQFTRIDLAPQLDDYNCGVFVLLFIDLQLYGVQVTGLDSESLSREAMEFFRYRHLSLILASIKESTKKLGH
ncbi:hypothetical protein F442_11664 [Phytophthora nicotianae P10297]|uniref:Ubiquitin-like protease family profile domain-containing protein n=1 Tax=Phytophthora nicotianae P10297 TaxID=1317064 RepID=W2Z4F6_PHYNI|nr:hypothetical protein F442_11664 [Phytophthora nicotianae P10297]